MRTILYITLFLFTLNFLQAQDTLYKTDGSKQIVKIMEINETQVKYKQSSNPNGTTYVIGKDDVIKIAYETRAVGIIAVPAVIKVNKE